MFKPEEVWEIIKRNAEKAKKAKTVWHSIKNHHRYSVLDVSEDSISILKIETGEKDSLKLRHIQKAYDVFKKNNRVSRGKLIKKSVVKETALVLFHPQVVWSKNKKHIIIEDK